MLDDTPTGSDTEPTTEAAPAKKAAAKKAPAKKAPAKATAAKKAPAKKTTVTTRTRKTAAKKTADTPPEAPTAEPPATDAPTAESAPVKKAAAKKAPAKAAAAKKAPARKTAAKKTAETESPADAAPTTAPGGAVAPLFQAPEAATAPARKPRKKAASPDADSSTPDDAQDAGATTTTTTTTRTRTRSGAKPKPDGSDTGADESSTGPDTEDDQDSGDESGDGARRRRRRGGRRRRKSGGEGDGAQDGSPDSQDARDTAQEKSGSDQADRSSGQNRRGSDDGDDDDDSSSPSSRRRRRRRRTGEDGGDGGDDPQNTVTRVRKTRSPEDQITSLAGSTRLEAKKQRRREGREAGRRRAPIVSEAEFLARRESVDRVMAIRQRDDLTQIAVLEDKVLVEHYVARESQTSLIGNVYLGRVQNVLPSMEAAFIDIGKGRNAVLYAGEVNWSALGHKDGQPRKIESVLSSGQTILVQVTKDPVGHKGARLTSQISLAGRFLVYVPDGTNSGISRKLPDTERSRLKALLKEIVPDGAGVIVRTAAEGASEEELTSDVERLKARWEDIDKKAANKGAGAQLLYGEPDLMLKVVRDLFTEDFGKLVVQGDDAWETVKDYVTHVAPDLEERLEKYDDSKADLFAAYRVDEQIQKGLDRKVWLPSGGSLVIDRTEAMTVVDVNTGKFTGSGGNLEETVTKNNLEAAEEMVRQLRLRDIGGIIVIDFIDMVLESNRDLVLRRLVECLGRDRTRHQVAEVTSLGLVQMTRKRIGTGLVEAFSENCEHCNGRGVVIADEPVEPKRDQDAKRGQRRSRGGRGRGDDGGQQESNGNGNGKPPTPKDVAAMARTPKPEDSDETVGTPDETVETPAETAPDSPATEAAEVEAPEQPAAPAEPVAPKVVTRTRNRRSASRPAETPPAADQAPVAETPEPAVETPAPEPVVEAAAPEPVVETPAPEPVAPKVVTRTRGRSASRPAGPPAATGSPDQSGSASALPGVIGQPPVDGAVEPGTSDTEVGTRPVVEHVPVKKRGARKR